MNSRSRRELKLELEIYGMFGLLCLGLAGVIFLSYYGGDIGNGLLGMAAVAAGLRVFKWWQVGRNDQNEMTGLWVSYGIAVAFWNVGNYFWGAGWFVVGVMVIISITAMLVVSRKKNSKNDR